MFFTKMQGTGNDFIIIEDLNCDIKDYSGAARVLCDRHFGIGADGLLIVNKSDTADGKMLIYNSDGSQAEMCGNGVRCFAKYLYDRHISEKDMVTIETLDGIKSIQLIMDKGSVTGARVNMGRPELDPAAVPVLMDGEKTVERRIMVGEDEYTITSMRMGVPHTVVFVENVDAVDAGTIGSKIEKSRYFPEGTNVNFVEVLNDEEIRVRTWERGAGLTLACGTGACASLVACVLNGKALRKATAHVPGGDLVIEWSDSGDVFMTGPCKTVFTGEYLDSDI